MYAIKRKSCPSLFISHQQTCPPSQSMYFANISSTSASCFESSSSSCVNGNSRYSASFFPSVEKLVGSEKVKIASISTGSHENPL